jgi:methylated-DNA-[protein]-cysteine S-methyltransferase
MTPAPAPPDALEALLASGPPAAPASDAGADLDRATEAFRRRADADGLVDVAWTSVDSPIGPLALAATDRGLVCITFGSAEPMVEHLAERLSPRVLAVPGRLDPVRRELDEYFDGRRTSFALPIDWSLYAEGFRGRVLRRLYRDVGFGHVVSYRDLAVAEGTPGASRAVGTAMATNPIPIVVPCHRVLRTGGALGGYGGGLDAKRWLLRLEGVLLT